MASLNLLILLLLPSIGVNSQYNTPPPYGRDGRDQYDRQDRTNPPYGQPYDRQNPQYGQYDRQNPPYIQPYDRQNQYNQYNQSQPYGRQNQYGNQSQYGNQGPPYDTRGQYDRDQYGNTRDPQYGGNRDQYGNRDQQNRDQYGNRDQQNRDQYGGNRDPQYGNRDQYGGNRDQQYGGNRGQQYGNRDQHYTGNRNEQYGGGSNFGGPQYGSSPYEGDDNCCQEYCYGEDEQPYVNFATKTAYQIVYGKSSNQHRIPECTPVQFWSINRHGTRYPGANTISRLRQLNRIHTEIIRNYDDRQSFPSRGKLCMKDLDLFRRWRWNESISESNANMLTQQGVDDLKFLARRFSSRFEELLREPYSEAAYNFQYTDVDRAHDSYQAYIEGLFNKNAYQVHANVNNDKLVKPTKSCEAWTRQVDENPQTLYEYMRFKQMPDYQQMVRDTFRRLGFRFTLNETILADMYDMCRYERAWNLNSPSPWCMVFNKEQLKLLEYAEDLKYYYKGGYGKEINRRIGCPPLKDLYEKFERTVNGNSNGNKVTVFFTHSITIQTFLTAMGIAKDDEPLRADNYFRQARRKWRTSIIDPFASNLAAVLYQCRSGERHRVMFFLNEHPVEYPDCSVGLCNWSVVKNKLENAAARCDLEFCNENAATALQHNYIIYLISFVAICFTLRY